MRLAITGPNGFVGRHLVAAALAAGHEVVALDRAALAQRDPQVKALLQGCDALVHLAARAHQFGGAAQDQASYWRDNVVLTERLLRLCGDAQIGKFLFLSTIGVYGKQVDAPIVAGAPLRPDTIYAATKIIAEQRVQNFCARHSMHWLIVRPPLIYGADAPGNIGKLNKLIRLGLPLPLGSIRNKRSMIAVENLSTQLLELVTDNGAQNVILLAKDAKDLSTPDLLQKLAALQAKRLCLLPFPLFLLKLAAKLMGKSAMLEPLYKDYVVEEGYP